MTQPFSRALVFASALLLVAPSLPQAQPTPPDNRDVVLDRVWEALNKDQRNLRFNLEREQVKRSKAPAGFTDFFLGDSNPDLWRFNKEMQMYSANTSRAESAYRQSLIAEIVADTKGLSREQVAEYLRERAHNTLLSKQRTRNNAEANLLRYLETAGTEEDKIKDDQTAALIVAEVFIAFSAIYWFLQIESVRELLKLAYG